MDETTNKQLTDILDSYEAKRVAAQQKLEQEKTEHELFLEDFTRLATSTIRPAMEEISEQLKKRGHEFEITEQQESIGSEGRTHNAGITLMIYPNGQRSRYPNERNTPHIGFMTHSYKRNVYVYECTMMPGRGGRAGSAREYELNQITTQVIHDHILKVLAEAMGR